MTYSNGRRSADFFPRVGNSQLLQILHAEPLEVTLPSVTMRLSPQRLAEITGYKRPRAQTAWFREHLGARVPCDRWGPILTESAYEGLLASALGLTRRYSEPDAVERPHVRLRGS